MPKMATKVGRKNHLSFCCFLFMFLLLLQSHVGSSRKLLSDPVVANAGLKNTCQFDRIYQLGDATSDTGNYVTENPSSFYNRFPYGITLGKPTGRASNGLLMIDYFASAFGVPYLNPYKSVEGANYSHGVNFAVAGATALPVETLESKGLPPHGYTYDGWFATIGLQPLHFATNSSLNVQLEWMASHFNNTCQSSEECQELLKNSLFIIGEIGAIDYSFASIALGEEKLNGFLVEVVENIMQAVKTVIGFGATKVIVPGHFPIGCLPAALSFFSVKEEYPGRYDSNHCLASLNKFVSRHNQILKTAIEELKKEYPKVAIVYADYYNAYLSVLSNAQKLGFVNKFSACCGSGETYNFDFGKPCGMPEVTSCRNPDNHISWDGFSLTQQAYKFIADYLIDSISPQMSCS